MSGGPVIRVHFSKGAGHGYAFRLPFSVQMIAALLAAVMVIFGGARCAARRAYVRARIAERCHCEPGGGRTFRDGTE
jgi:hypothetical protein